MLPAILTENTVVTGSHHGDAFGKLSEKEKSNNDLLSGFLDEQKLKFTTENRIIYLKEIILIRHAESCQQETITDKGREQAKLVAAFLAKFNISDFQAFSSTYTRCVQTLNFIMEENHINYHIKDNFCKKTDEEDSEDFKKRVIETLDYLPSKSIVVTHTDFIQTSLMITSSVINIESVPNCSLTYISKNKLIWVLKTPC